jgi:hypothetical protein
MNANKPGWAMLCWPYSQGSSYCGSAMDGEWFTRLTSNDFLSSFGNPTRVEASIGRLYQEGGLDAAFAWMDENLIPLFRKQIGNKR